MFTNELPAHQDYLQHFRVSPCTGPCIEGCMHYHEGELPRRLPTKDANGEWSYKPYLCKFPKPCRYQNSCTFAHTKEEVYYHPLVYKTKKCSYMLNNGICTRYGIHCPYSHDDYLRTPNGENKPSVEVAFDLATFKTLPCSSQAIHDKKTCHFYHHYGDMRRNPYLFRYAPVKCPNVIEVDKTGPRKECHIGQICNKAHNKVEIYYHPATYKQARCKYQDCNVKGVCSFLHEGEEKNIEKKPLQEKNIFEDTGNIDWEKEAKMLAMKSKILTNLLEQAQKKNKEYLTFNCHYCSENVGIVVYQCGHLGCSSCATERFCIICGISANKITSIRKPLISYI
ncbi:unnamed protein product [Blepharisma stoltei]|uniref:C3H1-type domain-containing protein n=1 Tax=Blepharisma stoltei TaxID=1481888 RepID=A0AAU9J5Z0_9CILI|nr:unnamed protein product [Blepharisma stoltei]